MTALVSPRDILTVDVLAVLTDVLLGTDPAEVVEAALATPAQWYSALPDVTRAELVAAGDQWAHGESGPVVALCRRAARVGYRAATLVGAGGELVRPGSAQIACRFDTDALYDMLPPAALPITMWVAQVAADEAGMDGDGARATALAAADSGFTIGLLSGLGEQSAAA